MKLAKLLTAVSVALVAAMVLASSASATVCSGSGTGEACKTAAHGKHWTGSFDATSTSVTLTMTNGSGSAVRTLTCSSTLSGQVTNATTGAATINSLTLSACSIPNCTNLAFSLPRTGGSAFPWAATMTASGLNNTNGILHITGFSMKFTATCNFITTSCEWEAATGTAEVKGGAPASIVFASMPLEKKAGAEFICGTKADWSGSTRSRLPPRSTSSRGGDSVAVSGSSGGG